MPPKKKKGGGGLKASKASKGKQSKLQKGGHTANREKKAPASSTNQVVFEAKANGLHTDELSATALDAILFGVIGFNPNKKHANGKEAMSLQSIFVKEARHEVDERVVGRWGLEVGGFPQGRV